MTNTRTLIERTRETLKEQRDYWETVHDRQTTATPEYNTAIAIIASIDEQDAALRDLLAALPQAQTFSSTCVCGHPELRHFYQPTKRGACMEEGCDCEETRLRKHPAAPPAPDARLTALERFNPAFDAFDDEAYMEKEPDGEWVRYVDVEASLRAPEGTEQ